MTIFEEIQNIIKQKKKTDSPTFLESATFPQKKHFANPQLLSTDKQAQNLNLSLRLFSLKQIIVLFAVEKKQLKCKWCFFMSRIYSLKP